MRCFWYQGRTHLSSTIPIRQSEVYSDQKNIIDLMFEDGPTSPPLHTGLYIAKEIVLSTLTDMKRVYHRYKNLSNTIYIYTLLILLLGHPNFGPIYFWS